MIECNVVKHIRKTAAQTVGAFLLLAMPHGAQEKHSTSGLNKLSTLQGGDMTRTKANEVIAAYWHGRRVEQCLLDEAAQTLGLRLS